MAYWKILNVRWREHALRSISLLLQFKPGWQTAKIKLYFLCYWCFYIQYSNKKRQSYHNCLLCRLFYKTNIVGIRVFIVLFWFASFRMFHYVFQFVRFTFGWIPCTIYTPAFNACARFVRKTLVQIVPFFRYFEVNFIFKRHLSTFNFVRMFLGFRYY